MKTKKKEALEKRHAEQVLKEDVWKLKNELLEYCKSDVRLVIISGEINKWNPIPLRFNPLLDGMV